MPQLDAEKQLALFRAYTKWMALLLSVLILLPTLIGLALKPAGLYMGIQYNFDDHMVYAGWMRQAMEGRILFENRFTTDPNPASPSTSTSLPSAGLPSSSGFRWRCTPPGSASATSPSSCSAG